MEIFKKLYEVLRGILFFTLGALEVILVVQVILKFTGALAGSSFANFWSQLSTPLVALFDGTLHDIVSDNTLLELNSVIAMALYLIAALLLLKILNSTFRGFMKDKVVALLRSFLLFLETLLVLRFAFKLMGAELSSFTKILYDITEPFYSILSGILHDLNLANRQIELATLVILIILIVLDFSLSKLLKLVFAKVEMADKKSKERALEVNSTMRAPVQPQQIFPVRVQNLPSGPQASAASLPSQSTIRPTQVETQRPPQPLPLTPFGYSHQIDSSPTTTPIPVNKEVPNTNALMQPSARTQVVPPVPNNPTPTDALPYTP